VRLLGQKQPLVGTDGRLVIIAPHPWNPFFVLNAWSAAGAMHRQRIIHRRFRYKKLAVRHGLELLTTRALPYTAWAEFNTVYAGRRSTESRVRSNPFAGLLRGAFAAEFRRDGRIDWQWYISSQSGLGIAVYKPVDDGIESWLNLNNAARLLQVTPKTLRVAAKAGEIKALHPLPDGPWIFSRAVLSTAPARAITERARQNPRHPAGSHPDQQCLFSPSAFAVFRLMTSSNLVGACTGKSAGFSPPRPGGNLTGSELAPL